MYVKAKLSKRAPLQICDRCKLVVLPAIGGFVEVATQRLLCKHCKMREEREVKP